MIFVDEIVATNCKSVASWAGNVTHAVDAASKRNDSPEFACFLSDLRLVRLARCLLQSLVRVSAPFCAYRAA